MSRVNLESMLESIFLVRVYFPSHSNNQFFSPFDVIHSNVYDPSHVPSVSEYGIMLHLLMISHDVLPLDLIISKTKSN